jgi:hypothetical protein
MRIYLDLDSRQILSTPNRPVRNLEFKRRDHDSLELQFVRGGTVVAVSSGTTVQFGLKPIDQYSAGFYSTGAFVKSGSGEAAIFSAAFTLNTQPIAQAFDLEPKSISAMLEIELRDGDTVASSVTLPVTIANDVIRGDEATPAAMPDGKATQAEAQAGTDNTKWMTPLRTKQAITQAAGSYAPATGIAPTAITGTAVVSNDARLSDSRTPTSHKSSHATGGSDAITPADIGAATSAQGAKADTSLQQGAYISAASLEVGTIAAGQTADLYVGQNGNVGIGTESPTERLTINGNLDMLGGKIKNLQAPDSADDAVRLADLDARVPAAPSSGTFSLQCVDGVISWVGV